jgi:hypothetical protein
MKQRQIYDKELHRVRLAERYLCEPYTFKTRQLERGIGSARKRRNCAKWAIWLGLGIAADCQYTLVSSSVRSKQRLTSFNGN